VKPRLLGFKILEHENGKKEEDLTASQILEMQDRRDFLDIDYDPVRKEAVLGKIMPEGKEKAIDEEEFKVVSFDLYIFEDVF
jgi:hypothetical protein